MPHAENSGVKLYYEVEGSGPAILFPHEYAGDYRAWPAQVAHFAKSHTCITISARGYPGSDIPDDPAAYSQEIAEADALAVLDHLGIDRAHICGISMGAYTAPRLRPGGASRPSCWRRVRVRILRLARPSWQTALRWQI